MIHAFGDESIGAESVSYAAAVFPEHNVQSAEEILATAKQSVGVNREAALHCRELFSGDARKGTPWAPVQAADISSMVVRLCQGLKQVELQPVVAVIFPRQLPPQPVAPGQPNKPLADKGVATLAYQAVATALVLRSGQEKLRFWIDPDKTKIPWGMGERQVNSTRSFYLDLVPGEAPTQLVPRLDFATTAKPRLLEISDLYAFVTRKACSPGSGRQHRWFRDTYALIAPQECVFAFNPNPEWVKAQPVVPADGPASRARR